MSVFGFDASPHFFGEAGLKDVLFFHLRGLAAADALKRSRYDVATSGVKAITSRACSKWRLDTVHSTSSSKLYRPSGFSGSVIAASPMALTKTLGLGRQVLQSAVEQNIAFTVCTHMGGDLHPSAPHGLQRCCFLS